MFSNLPLNLIIFKYLTYQFTSISTYFKIYFEPKVVYFNFLFFNYT